MEGFDVSLVPTIFLAFQGIVIGLFVLVHIFLGRKRGVVKTFLVFYW
ncbi:hypothetical protein ACL_0454 [Acholeplasma laidlawii PG-8A]|uniref:Uncharacterized protein n=1 Tax=Acholeplasma laidlawii (strain PG-8A) TaxID=441768 RepID=A9NFE3_ACHLI|nr:hypothetical protein ACL_0454 [Acholeplasma laidlawii PG-8A]